MRLHRQLKFVGQKRLPVTLANGGVLSVAGHNLNLGKRSTHLKRCYLRPRTVLYACAQEDAGFAGYDGRLSGIDNSGNGVAYGGGGTGGSGGMHRFSAELKPGSAYSLSRPSTAAASVGAGRPQSSGAQAVGAGFLLQAVGAGSLLRAQVALERLQSGRQPVRMPSFGAASSPTRAPPGAAAPQASPSGSAVGVLAARNSQLSRENVLLRSQLASSPL
eukprot:359650-Chlamydomonas_euryale.AAC.15